MGGVEKLRLGKLNERMLNLLVLRYTGGRRKDVVLGPRFGEDAGAVKVGRDTIVVAMDPITGSKEMVGWFSVHVNANDVAVCGARPEWFSVCILFPPRSTPKDFREVSRQIDKAAKKLGVAVVTGHSEIAPHISAPIVVGTMKGRLVSNRIITSSGAEPGDFILMSKFAGLEGLAILATDFKDRLLEKGVDKKVLDNARRYYSKISVVDEALALARSGSVTAMHDPTEGGVIGGLYELAKASNCGFIVYGDNIPVTREGEIICKALEIDPLKLISSGVLLATSKKPDNRIMKRKGLKIIGRMTRKKEGMVIVRKEEEYKIREQITDELWRILE